MSGGHFNYKDSALKNEVFGWNDCRNVFEDREISEIVWDTLNLIHDFDWYISGDTCEDDYLKSKARFKKKWLDNKGVRGKRIIDESVDELRQELYKTYCINSERQSERTNRRW